jgi:hypothetical protein
LRMVTYTYIEISHATSTLNVIVLEYTFDPRMSHWWMSHNHVLFWLRDNSPRSCTTHLNTNFSIAIMSIAQMRKHFFVVIWNDNVTKLTFHLTYPACLESSSTMAPTHSTYPPQKSYHFFSQELELQGS